MQSTSSRNSDYENNPNKAALHALIDIQNNTYKNWFVPKADAESRAGGVSSNVRDMARWLRLQLNGGVFDGEQGVDRAALDETHEPQPVLRQAPDRRRAGSSDPCGFLREVRIPS